MLELTERTYRERLSPPVRISGYPIGHVSTQASPSGTARQRPRWQANWVWRTESGLLVLVREAFSRVYHTEPTTCTTIAGMPYGEQCVVADMATELADLGYDLEDALSCDDCRPPWPHDLRGDSVIRYEFVRRTIDRCPEGARQVVGRLTKRKLYSGVNTSELPEPARQLLEQCRTNDPSFGDEMADGPTEVIS